MKVTTFKECYCYTCHRRYHYLGINSHRAAHRRRAEDCTIAYTNGNVMAYKFSDTPDTVLTVSGGRKGTDEN